MVNLTYAAQLLPLLLLSPTTSTKGSVNKNSVVLANGFTATHLNLRPSFLPRGGSLDNNKSALSSSSSAVEADIGPALEVISQDNWDLLSDRGKAALSRLILYDMSNGNDGQKHVYGDWPAAGVEDEEKRMLAEQVRSCVEKSVFHLAALHSTHLCMYIYLFLGRLLISMDPIREVSLPIFQKLKLF